jgi:hypothetical protein
VLQLQLEKANDLRFVLDDEYPHNILPLSIPPEAARFPATGDAIRLSYLL